MTETPDIEVGRYALRTFVLRAGHLGSLYRVTDWDGGTAIAQCIRDRVTTLDQIVDPVDHTPPGDDCTCGLYGTLTLEQLVREYGTKGVRRCVVVFAAEGQTVIGSRGLRTAAARVVAYWCRGPKEEVVLSMRCPDARHFEKIADMLEAYKFPPYTATREGWGYDVVTFPDYNTEPELSEPSPPPPIPTSVTYTVTTTYVGWGNSWNQIAPLMSAATPGGIRAVQDLTGYTVTPSTDNPRHPMPPVHAPKGTVTCSSSTRPHNPPIGQVIYEMDTRQLMVYSKPTHHPAAWDLWNIKT